MSIGNQEECKSAAVPLPTVSIDVGKDREEDHQPGDNEDNGYKTSNFSRWSDTQLDDGTCSLSFLKLCKTEEERTRLLEMERIKLQNLLKSEIKRKAEQVDANPFVASTHDVE